MARIGLDNFLYGILTEGQDGTPTYGVAKKPGKAISCSVSIECPNKFDCVVISALSSSIETVPL